MTSQSIVRWGILSTGKIAHAFAEGLRALPDARLVAVGSRSQEAAERFGRLFDVPHRHGSYEALVQDPDVDVIYIGTPHPFHKENTLLCLEAGKAVLCEKPFALNALEAAEMIRVARARGLFLMEAMWTRFLPAFAKLRALLEEGAIGEVRLLTADFGFRAAFDPESRLFDPALGGGALLDLGIYPLALASAIFGPPERIASQAHLGETGVDEQAAIILGYAGGRQALLSASLRIALPTEAQLMGTRGRIRVHNPIFRPQKLTLYPEGVWPPPSVRIPGRLKRLGYALGLDRWGQRLRKRPGKTWHFPLEGNGYNYEAAEVMRCLREGALESPVMPLDETLAIMRTMDAIRAQWGLTYPMEVSDGNTSL